MSVITLFQSHLPSQFSDNNYNSLKELTASSGCTFADAKILNHNDCFLIVLSKVKEEVHLLYSILQEISPDVRVDENPTYSFAEYEIEVVSDICQLSRESVTTSCEDLLSQQFEGMKLNNSYCSHLKLVFAWSPYLPRLKDKHRCMGVNTSGIRCKHERFRGWCYAHKEQGIQFMDTINGYVPRPSELPIWQLDALKASFEIL